MRSRGRADRYLTPALRLPLALFPLWCTGGVLVLWTTWRHKAIVGGVAALTIASPAYGLLALAVLTPLGTFIEGAADLPYRLSEAWVLAFLGAWLLRAATDRPGPRLTPTMRAVAWLLAGAAAASVATVAWRLRESPGQIASLRIWLAQAYYVYVHPVGFVDGARIVEGIALVAATLYAFRHRPSLAVSLPAALAGGGALAAAASVAVWAGAGPAPLAQTVGRIGYRSAHIGDLNAAGSYFAMVVCLALGMTMRARGSARAAWAALSAANAVGLWFAESRSAIAAALIVVTAAAGWALTARWTTRARIIAIAALLVCGIGLAGARAYLLQRDPGFHGAGFREQFNETSLRMIAARPFAGVGVGQYYMTSMMFLSPQMAWTYGRENAHNNLLQVAAELGIPGAILFLMWTAGGFVLVARGLGGAADPRLLGAAAGLAALLTTCTTGHPLLIDQVVFPFWIQFGLAIGLAESARMNAASNAAAPARASRAWQRAAVAAAAVTIAAAAFVSATRGRVVPPAGQAVDGFYGWEEAEDGRRFRWSEQYASIFVPADVRSVRIPVRVPVNQRALTPLGLEISVGGVPRQERALVTHEWSVVELRMPEVPPPGRFNRIDLRVDKTWQPAIYVPGSADMRRVGVQVGQCELVRGVE